MADDGEGIILDLDFSVPKKFYTNLKNLLKTIRDNPLYQLKLLIDEKDLNAQIKNIASRVQSELSNAIGKLKIDVVPNVVGADKVQTAVNNLQQKSVVAAKTVGTEMGASFEIPLIKIKQLTKAVDNIQVSTGKLLSGIGIPGGARVPGGEVIPGGARVPQGAAVLQPGVGVAGGVAVVGGARVPQSADIAAMNNYNKAMLANLQTQKVYSAQKTKMQKQHDLETASYFALASVYYGAVRGLQSYVRQYAEFETMLVRVGRLLNLSGTALDDMGAQFTKIAISLGVTTNSVLQLAEAAARMGVGRKDLLQFTVDVQKVATAIQMPAAETAEMMKSFTLLFKVGTKDVVAMGNALNAVADASAISPAGLAQFVKYLGPVANQFETFGKKGFGAMTGIGAVLGELGVSAEVAGSGMQRIFNAMINRGDEAARIAGMTSDAFKELVKTDINAALLKMAAGFGKLSAEEQLAAKQLLKLNDIRVGRVITLLAQNTDYLAQKQAIATRAFSEGTSVENENARQLATLNSMYIQLSNSIGELMRTAIIPTVNSLKDLIEYTVTWIKENKALAESLATVVKWILEIGAALGSLAIGAFIWSSFKRGLVGMVAELTAVIFGIIPLMSKLVGILNPISIIKGLEVFRERAKSVSHDVALMAEGAMARRAVAGKAPLPLVPVAAPVATWSSFFAKFMGWIAAAGKAIASAFAFFLTPAGWIVGFLALVGAAVGYMTYKIAAMPKGLRRDFSEEEKKTADATKTLAQRTEDVTVAYRKLNDSVKQTQDSIDVLGSSFVRLGKFEQEWKKAGSPEDLLSYVNKRSAATKNMVAGLLKENAVVLRTAMKSFVFSTADRDEQVQRTKEFVTLINKQIPPMEQKIEIDFDAETLLPKLQELESHIIAIAAAARQGDIGAGEFLRQIIAYYLEIGDMAGLLTHMEKVNNQFKLIAKTLNITNNEAAELFFEFRQIGVEAMKLDAVKLQNLQVAFGAGSSMIQGMKNMAKSLIEFRKEIMSFDLDRVAPMAEIMTADDARFLVSQFKDEKTMLAGIVNLMAEGTVHQQKTYQWLRETVVKLQYEKGLREGILKDMEETERAAESGLAGLRAALHEHEKRLAYSKEELKNNKDIYFNQNAITMEQKLINDLKEKIASKDKEAKAAARDEASYDKISTKLKERQRDLMIEHSRLTKDVEDAIEGIGSKEKDILSTLEEQRYTTEQSIKLRKDAAINAAIAEANAAQKTFDNLRKQKKQADDNLKSMSKNANDYIKSLARIINPNEILQGIEEMAETAAEKLRAGVTPEQAAQIQKGFAPAVQFRAKENTEALIRTQQNLHEERIDRIDEINNLEKSLSKAKGEEAAKIYRDLEKARRELRDTNKNIAKTENQLRDAQNQSASTMNEVNAMLKEAAAEGIKKYAEEKKRAEDTKIALENSAKSLEKTTTALDQILKNSVEIMAAIKAEAIAARTEPITTELKAQEAYKTTLEKAKTTIIPETGNQLLALTKEAQAITPEAMTAAERLPALKTLQAQQKKELDQAIKDWGTVTKFTPDKQRADLLKLKDEADAAYQETSGQIASLTGIMQTYGPLIDAFKKNQTKAAESIRALLTIVEEKGQALPTEFKNLLIEAPLAVKPGEVKEGILSDAVRTLMQKAELNLKSSMDITTNKVLELQAQYKTVIDEAGVAAQKNLDVLKTEQSANNIRDVMQSGLKTINEYKELMPVNIPTTAPFPVIPTAPPKKTMFDDLLGEIGKKIGAVDWSGMYMPETIGMDTVSGIFADSFTTGMQAQELFGNSVTAFGEVALLKFNDQYNLLRTQADVIRDLTTRLQAAELPIRQGEELAASGLAAT